MADKTEAGTVHAGLPVRLNKRGREASGTVLEECYLVGLTEKGLQQGKESLITTSGDLDAGPPTRRREERFQ